MLVFYAKYIYFGSIMRFSYIRNLIEGFITYLDRFNNVRIQNGRQNDQNVFYTTNFLLIQPYYTCMLNITILRHFECMYGQKYAILPGYFQIYPLWPPQQSAKPSTFTLSIYIK